MPGTVVSSIVIDDRHPNVTYAGGEWTRRTYESNDSGLYNNTESIFGVDGATATVSFYGNAVEYWGNQSPDHGLCGVTLDGTVLGTVNSFAVKEGHSILLYSKDDLPLGDHTLVIRVLGDGTPSVCEVDRFVAKVTSDGNTSGNKKAKLLAVAAGTIGGIAILTLLLLIFLCYRRRNLKKAAAVTRYEEESNYSWSEKPKRSDTIGLRPFILPTLPNSASQDRSLERAANSVDEKVLPAATHHRESHRVRAESTSHHPNDHHTRHSSTRSTRDSQRRSPRTSNNNNSSPQTATPDVSPGGVSASKSMRRPLTAPDRAHTTVSRQMSDSRMARRVTIDLGSHDSGTTDRATYPSRESLALSPQIDSPSSSSARPSPSSPKRPRASPATPTSSARRSNTEKSRYMGSQRTPVSAGAPSPVSAIRGVAGPSRIEEDNLSRSSVRRTESTFTETAPPSYQA